MNIIGISGNRKINDKDRKIIYNKIKDIINKNNVDKIIFGGAIGTDTWSLFCAGSIKNTLRLNKPKLIVIVPDKVINQQKQAQNVIKTFANEVIELNNKITRKDGWKSFKIRNLTILNKSNKIIAFHNNSYKGGTASMIWECQKRMKEYEIITIMGVDKNA